MRLTGPSQEGNRGIVEMFFAGQWNTFCDDHVTNNVTQVICKKIGHTPATSWRTVLDGTRGRRIVLKRLHCDGTEDDLMDCRHVGVFLQSCGSHYIHLACK